MVVVEVVVLVVVLVYAIVVLGRALVVVEALGTEVDMRTAVSICVVD